MNYKILKIRAFFIILLKYLYDQYDQLYDHKMILLHIYIYIEGDW